MLAREFMTTLHDANDAFVADENLMLYAALATKLEHRASVAHESDMTIAQGRKSEALVIACVFHVADAYARGIEQHHHGCDDLLTRQTWKRQISSELAPQLRQRRAEGHHMVELCAVAHLPPARMVTILLAAAGILAGGLEVSPWAHADPHILVRRRDRKTRDAPQFTGVRQPPLRRSHVVETFTGADATDSRLVAGDVDESRLRGHLRRLRHHGGCIFNRR